MTRLATMNCLPVLLLALVPGIASGQKNVEDYRENLETAEQAKRTGDFAGMESSLRAALRLGPGDEYAWRSLAWAQARQGKWRESLQSANENIRRHGATAWSL